MKVLAEFEAILADVDRRREPLLDVYLKTEFQKALEGLGAKLDNEQRTGVWAELIAWNLGTEAQNLEPWHSYFGPYWSQTDADGQKVFSPPVDQVNNAILQHWISRIDVFSHPRLQARYADLSWELARKVANEKPDFRHGKIAVDAYLKGVEEGLVTEFYEQIVSTSRARDIALQLRDKNKSEAATVILLQLHDKAVAGEGWWQKTYQHLISDKNLTDDRRAYLAQSLERLIVDCSDKEDPEKFDPHQIKEASDFLTAYYSRVKKRSDIIRIKEIEGRSFEYAADLNDSLCASAMLQNAENAYLDVGKQKDATRARIAREKAIEASGKKMHLFEATQTIPKEEIGVFLSWIVTDDLLRTLVRITNQFVPEVIQIKAQIQNGGLMDAIPILIMEKDHQSAALGCVEDDLEGRVIHRAWQNIERHSLYLHWALQSATEKHEVTPYVVTGFAEKLGLFDDSSFLLEGVGAWFSGDHLKAIHVLVPQVERALRAIAGKLGQPVTKKHPHMSDREVSIGMGDILGNMVVKDALGDDVILYFKCIYSDPRGLNLRNSIAHGTHERGMMGQKISNLLIHSLLVLGLWDQLSFHRKAKAAVVG